MRPWRHGDSGGEDDGHSMSQLTGDEYLDRPFRPTAERLLAQGWGCPVRLHDDLPVACAEATVSPLLVTD
jgi:hypothetical protein